MPSRDQKRARPGAYAGTFDCERQVGSAHWIEHLRLPGASGLTRNQGLTTACCEPLFGPTDGFGRVSIRHSISSMVLLKPTAAQCAYSVSSPTHASAQPCSTDAGSPDQKRTIWGCSTMTVDRMSERARLDANAGGPRRSTLGPPPRPARPQGKAGQVQLVQVVQPIF
jgi:hypothetical protein